MQIIHVTFDDSKDIWHWRNEPLTRSMSITTSEIGWDEHSRWFNESLKNPNRLLYIGIHQEQKVGLCRFDIDPNGKFCETSIHLNPKMRGKNLSIEFLSSAIEIFRQSHNMSLFAQIKNENAASIKCFTKCGFIFEKKDGLYNYYKTPQISYRSPDETR